MSKITENEIELFAIDLFEALGYSYIYAPNIQRSHEEVLLEDRLLSSLEMINPTLHVHLLEDAIKQLKRLKSTQLLADNEIFHRFLVEGVRVESQKDGVTRGEIVRLVDFEDVQKNDFVVANQFTVVENSHTKRPDIILFVNGLPLVVVELKNPTDENATIKSAYNQLQTYKEFIPSLFTFNEICVISDGMEAKAGSISAGFTRYMSWKSSDGVSEASRNAPELETLINGMLSPKVLLDLARSFIVFEKSKKEDKNGITTIETVKKLCAYHQYYAVNKAVERTKLASGEDGDKKAGVIWHTQGSGKSLSMLFYTGKIVLELNNQIGRAHV